MELTCYTTYQTHYVPQRVDKNVCRVGKGWQTWWEDPCRCSQLPGVSMVCWRVSWGVDPWRNHGREIFLLAIQSGRAARTAPTGRGGGARAHSPSRPPTHGTCVITGTGQMVPVTTNSPHLLVLSKATGNTQIFGWHRKESNIFYTLHNVTNY